MPTLTEEPVFTPRQAEILLLLGRGKTTREIAESLGVSHKTVETHRENLKAVLNLENHVQLIAYAGRWCERQGVAA